MKKKIKTSLVLILMLGAIFLIGNPVVAQQTTTVRINVTLNGASDGDFVGYYLHGVQEKKIITNTTFTILSGRKVKFVGLGKFLNWSGSTCGESSNNVLEFETSSDCDLVANFGTDTRRR